MRLSKYGIVLESLTFEDIDLVRNWRNSDHVRLTMSYQQYIDAEAQKQWFQSLDKQSNIYLLIKEVDAKIGLINLKNINWELGSAEAGIFIGEKEYLNSLAPLLATISIMEYAFEELKLNKLRAKISRTNFKAIFFNEGIGYVKEDGQEEMDFQYYYVTPQQFINSTKSIRSTLDKLK